MTQILALTVFMVVVMTLLWLWQVKTNDASVVDVVWSAGVGLAAVFFAATGPGDDLRRIVLALVGGFWGARLASYLLVNRVIGKHEDGRYQNLRARWGAAAHRNFFFFFQFQAGLVVAFGLPALAVAANPAQGLLWTDWLGIGVAILSIAGESISDRQLARFRGNPANRGRTCREGFWRYSRHPNYFFEWLHWFAYVLLGLSSPLWFLTLGGPVMMYVFLMKVTGIPHTEAQAIKSRGDDYRQYQATTSMFIPWFPKKQENSP